MNVQNYKYYDSNDEKQGSKFLGKNGIILISNQTDYNITQIINHLVETCDHCLKSLKKQKALDYK